MHQARKEHNLYGNILLLAPDGTPLCRKKQSEILFYLKKDLAFYVDEKTVKLKFEPSGLGHSNLPELLEECLNICAECGTDETLTKHHIIPSQYRKYLPVLYSGYRFFDVIVLCSSCHDSYTLKEFKLVQRLAEQYNAPIGGITSYKDEKCHLNKKSLLKAISYAYALTGNHIIPEERKQFLQGYIRNFLNKEPLLEDLEELKSLSTASENRNFQSHGELVVNQLTDYNEFIFMWRDHFRSNMTLKFAPKWIWFDYIRSEDGLKIERVIRQKNNLTES